MRAGAVGHEHRILGPRRQLGRDDLAVRKIDSAWHMPLGEMVGSAHVEQHEAGIGSRQRVVDVPAIRLETEAVGEVSFSLRGECGGDIDDGIGREVSPDDDALWPMPTPTRYRQYCRLS